MDARTHRRHKQVTPPNEYRTEFQRDRDRILYSSAFRRLAGVTQVAAVSERRLLHNRLTHSLKVAQIGRRMAERLREKYRGHPALAQLDPDVVEAAGLAHDLGHPPFGHVAETIMNEQMADFGGFEGNAQTFRILTKIAVRNDDLGLDLTRATLNAVLKYPRFLAAAATQRSLPLDLRPEWSDRSRGSKWGAYETERTDFSFAREGYDPERRSIEAVIMDWADDVSFATHDLDDYFRAGLIPLHDLERNADRFIAYAIKNLGDKETTQGFDSARFAQSWRSTFAERPIRTPFSDTRNDRIVLHSLMSAAISQFIEAVQLLNHPPYVRINETTQYVVEALKKLTWYYVIDSPALATLQRGQKTLIKNLLDEINDLLINPMSPKLPTALRELFLMSMEDPEMAYLERRQVQRRVACDYICSLTEDQAMDMYERMSGSSRASIFDAWFT